ncbi:hypothetical protein [Streptomyces sp. PSAA01]|uniref:hypothetical protein n=1 Tax=Streptomyces sp. PSAA01 TaxID=2912762 RepID=UPI001F366ACA|nr:hypothetical protein [Streptomyces sp. PSAA01]MCG0289039.1 hypothetical protein [Streptomyces sp. PSAA01]
MTRADPTREPRPVPRRLESISLRIRTVRAVGRCECLGECGRGTHTGRCPNLNGQPAYGPGSKVVLTVAHLDHTPENSDPANDEYLGVEGFLCSSRA